VTGLVNNETLANVTTGTLSFGTTATSGSNVGSYAINGGGLTSNGNYVFAQAASNATALTITSTNPQPAPAPTPAQASTPADTEKYLPQTTTIPKFPDNAQQVLSNTTSTASFGGLNYVAVPELATNSATASSTPPATTTGISTQPALDTTSSPGQGSIISAGNQSAPTGGGSLNYVASKDSSPSGNQSGNSTSPTSTTTVPQTSDTTGSGLTQNTVAPSETQPVQSSGSSLNYVASKDGSSSASTGDGKKSANELNVNDVTVPSSTGPLDVHVVNGGINVATLFGREQ
jgi:hypothetical protein